MKTAAIGALSLLVLAGGILSQNAFSFSIWDGGIFTSEFTGEIMDSYCAEVGHHTGVTKTYKNSSKGGCTLTCVKLGGAQFVLYDRKTRRTYKLDDQEQLEAFAGQKVIVTGTYDRETNVIHMIKIRPLIETARRASFLFSRGEIV